MGLRHLGYGCQAAQKLFLWLFEAAAVVVAAQSVYEENLVFDAESNEKRLSGQLLPE